MQAEEQPQQRGGGIYNYFQGATINNMVINGNMTKNGNENFHTLKNTEKQTFTDEQIARALEAIVGKDKPIDMKWKWVGAMWLLHFIAGFPVRAQDFCERVNKLPFTGELSFPCEYNNIRGYANLSFMRENPLDLNNVKVSKNDENVYFQIREVVMALERELMRNKDVESIAV